MALRAQRPLAGEERLAAGQVAAVCHRMLAIVLAGGPLLWVIGRHRGTGQASAAQDDRGEPCPWQPR
ncbi:MAG: hypothetical protein VCA55_13920 [Verrucomicrobiales bacterium]